MVVDSSLHFKQIQLLCNDNIGVGANGIVQCLEHYDYHIIKYFNNNGIDLPVLDIHFEIAAKFLRSKVSSNQLPENSFLIRGNSIVKRVEFKHNGEVMISDYIKDIPSSPVEVFQKRREALENAYLLNDYST